MQKRWLLYVMAMILLFLLLSCTHRVEPQPIENVRMTMEQIHEGAFTGGRLIYSQDDRVNLLKPGLLIPVKEMTRGWVKVENSEEYTFETLSTTYAYYYIVAVDETKITMDYLAYDENGEIIFREDNVQFSHDYVITSSRNLESSARQQDFLRSVSFAEVESEKNAISSALIGSRLLSFPNEIPNETQQMTSRSDDQTYRTVLFRLQQDATTQYAYANGLICAHPSEPALIMNTTYFATENLFADTDGVTIINFQSLGIPELSSGDYLLLLPENPEEMSSTRKITESANTGADFDLLTETADFLQVMGGVEISISGDLEQLTRQYGSRGTLDIIDLETVLTLWKKQGLEVDLDMKFLLRLDIAMDIVAHWNELSSKGHFYLLSTDHLYLILKVLSENADPENNVRIKLKEWKTIMKIGPVTIYANYLINGIASWKIPAMNQLQLGGGPWLDGKLGFDYDVGMKLKFAWGFFPYPSFWSDFGSSSFLDMGFKLITPTLPDNFTDEMQLNLGLEFQPIFRIQDLIEPSFTFPLMFENNLKKVHGQWSYSLDLHPAIDFWLGFKWGDSSKKWYIGRVWEHVWNLYKNNPQYLDEHDKGNLWAGAAISSSPIIGEDGTVYFTTDNGYLYALQHNADTGRFTQKWAFRYPESGQTQNYVVTSPVIDKGGSVYYGAQFQAFGSAPFSGIIAVSNNQMLWATNLSYPFTIRALAMGTDAEDNVLLFAGNALGDIYALNSSGKQLWKKNIGSGLDISAISVTQNGTLAVVANRSDNQSVVVSVDFSGNLLTPRDTSFVIPGKSGTYSGKIAINADGSLRIVTDLDLWAIASTYNKTLWKYSAASKISSNPVIAKDEKVYFGSDDNSLYCINPNGTLAWKYDAGSKIISTPLIGADGHIYICTEKGVVMAIASRDILDKDGKKLFEMGKMMWRSPKDPNASLGSITGSAAINTDGILFVPSLIGNLYAIKTDARGLSEAPWPKNGYNNQNTFGISYIPSSLRLIEKNDLHLIKMEGESATLQVEVLGGFPPYSYQWMKGSLPVAGANQPTFTVPALTLADEGEYHVIVKDSFTPHPKTISSPTTKVDVNSTRIGQKRWMYGDSFTMSPLMDNTGNLYAISKTGTLYRFSATDGRLIYSLPTRVLQTAPILKLYTDGKVPDLITINGISNKVQAYRIEPSKFEFSWEEQGTIPAGFRNLSIFYDGVIVSHLNGTINSYFTDSGHNIYDNRFIGYSMPTDMTIVKDEKHVYVMYFGTNNNELVAVPFDNLNNKLWKYQTKGKVVSPIAVDGDNTLYFADEFSNFYALTAKGTKKWSYDLTEGKKEDFKGVTASPIISSAGIVYVAKNNGKLFAFDTSGRKKWTFQAEGGIYATPILGNDNMLYICTTSGIIHALNATTGQPTGWQKYTAGDYRILGSPVLWDGKLIIAADSLVENGIGRIFAINVTSTNLDPGRWPKYRKDNQNSSSVQ